MARSPLTALALSLSSLIFVACSSGSGNDATSDDASGDANADETSTFDASRDGAIEASADAKNDAKPTDAFDAAEAGEPPLPPAAGKDRVLVVYNDKTTTDGDGDGVQDSKEVADYYVKKRQIPADHVLAVSPSDWPSLDYAHYDAEIAKPIQVALTKIGPTAIDEILLVYGVPFVVGDSSGTKASIDNLLMGLNFWTDATTIAWSQNAYFDLAPTFDKEVGHFDHAKFKFNGTEMYLVSRIDGPRGVAGPLDQIDQALYAERYLDVKTPGGFTGNIYVDARFGHDLASLATDPDVTSGAYYAYDQGDKNMAYAAKTADGYGFPVKLENTGASIGEDSAVWTDGSSAKKAPRTFMYGGWYNYGRYVDGFEWLPGSIGDDLDSGSLYYWVVESGDTYWGPNALLRGATCVAGVVTEPYLNGHPRPNILLTYMVKGYSWGEASAISTPSIGWMPINIGDPLYAPLRKDKPSVKDDKPPKLVGAPKVASASGKTTMTLLVDDTLDPEVVQVAIDYGKDTTYGSKSTSGEGYFRRPSIPLDGLTSGATVHYALTLTDPMGNVTKTSDATFVAP